MKIQRCRWVTHDPLYIDYHDHEWGIPQKDPQILFEMLCLEGQQAGLSWITVLKKRQAYRQIFSGFSAPAMAALTSADIDLLQQNPAIIRHRGKIEALVSNANALLAMEQQGECFSDFVWSFVNHQPIITRYLRYEDAPTFTPASVRLAKELKKRGFRFTGPTICHAFMQATGMVIDHQTDCFCHPDNRDKPSPEAVSDNG
ncbi:DNA-3-methyladenine glycosylase I [Tatumella terrea]